MDAAVAYCSRSQTFHNGLCSGILLKLRQAKGYGVTRNYEDLRLRVISAVLTEYIASCPASCATDRLRPRPGENGGSIKTPAQPCFTALRCQPSSRRSVIEQHPERLLKAYPNAVAGMKDRTRRGKSLYCSNRLSCQKPPDPPVRFQLPVRLALSTCSSAANPSCSRRCGMVASALFPRPPTSTRPRFTSSTRNRSEAGLAVTLRSEPISTNSKPG